MVHVAFPEESLYGALKKTVQGEETKHAPQEEIREKAGTFLLFLEEMRTYALTHSVPELLRKIYGTADFEMRMTALPAGEQRSANLRKLAEIAGTAEGGMNTGLYFFLKLLDEYETYEMDFGEPNTLSEEADVVRLMTIHKSKGLEFPICFVAGLAKRFNRRDLSGTVLIDPDLGIGCSYYEEEARVRESTFRREAVAEKLKIDQLGEELRILYVAMTRAKEKLYLTGYVKNYEALRGRLRLQKKAGEKEPLSTYRLEKARSYLDLVLSGYLTNEKAPVRIEVTLEKDLVLVREKEQDSLRQRKDTLASYRRSTAQYPDRELADRLLEQADFVYPHRDLSGLYTKTTVTELKEAYLAGQAAELEEGSAVWEPLPKETVEETIPRFLQEDTKEELTGAKRGSVIHRLLELLPYERFRDGEKDAAEEVRLWLKELLGNGLLQENEVDEKTAGDVLTFLKSDLGQRMARAHERGELFREQPFVLRVPAKELNPAFPETETILVQGIIDAFFEEDGKLILLDYKTDQVRRPSDLKDRYEVQIRLYERALSQILQKEVGEKYLYSVKFGEAVAL